MVLTATRTPKVRRRVRLDRPDRLSRDYVAQWRGSLLHQRLSRLEAEEDRLDAMRADRILSDPAAEYFDVRTGERITLGVAPHDGSAQVSNDPHGDRREVGSRIGLFVFDDDDPE